MKKIFTLACAVIVAVGAMAQTQLTIHIKKDGKYMTLGELQNGGDNMTAVSGSTLEAFEYTIDLEPGKYDVIMAGTTGENSETTISGSDQYKPAFTLASAQTVHFWGKVPSGKKYVNGLCSAMRYGAMDANWAHYAMGSASYGNTTATGYFVTPVAYEMKNLKFGVETKLLADDVLTSSGSSVVPTTTANSTTYTKSAGLKKFEFDYETWTVTYSDATTMDVKISAAGASTLCAPVDLTIPAGVGVKAYTLTYADEALKATEVKTTIPAGTPVLLNANEGVYSFVVGSVAETIETAKTSNNKDYMTTVTNGALNGVYQEKYVPQNAYVLQAGTKGVGFYKVEDATFPINAFRCYVSLPASAPAKLSIVYDDDNTTTGINEVVAAENNAMFNLAGQRVNANAKGIIIKNGKKYLNK